MSAVRNAKIAIGGREPGEFALSYEAAGFSLFFQFIYGADAFHFPDARLWEEIMPQALIGRREEIAAGIARFASERKWLGVIGAKKKEDLGSIFYVVPGTRISQEVGRGDNPRYTGEGRAAFESARPVI